MAKGVVKAPVEWLFDANISLCKLLGKLCAVTLDNNASSVYAVLRVSHNQWNSNGIGRVEVQGGPECMGAPSFRQLFKIHFI